MEIDDKIRNTIVDEVFKLFTKGKFEEGRVLLHRLYLENYKDIKSLFSKRLLIHNLAWAEYKIGEVTSAKVHIKLIKSEIEKDINYINNNMLDYCLLLNLYCEIYKDEISENEYKEINLFIANYHHETGNLGRECVALANVYLIDRRWEDVISLIVTLKEKNIDEYFIDAIFDELEKTNIETFNKAKETFNKAKKIINIAKEIINE